MELSMNTDVDLLSEVRTGKLIISKKSNYYCFGECSLCRQPSNMTVLLVLIVLPLVDLATVPDGSCPAGGSTCDTLVDNSKVLQDILDVQGCCTHPDCPAG